MDWMYEGKKSAIDNEQYLLGKKITNLHDDDDTKGDFSMAQESTVATGNVTVLERLDYESKVREDPLFEIRKNAHEHRKELMSNPLKKKRLQSRLKSALERDLLKHGATDSTSSDSSESDSDDSSDDVSKKYIAKSQKNKKLREALKEQLQKDLDRRVKSKKRKRHDSSPETRHREKHHRQTNRHDDDAEGKKSAAKEDRQKSGDSRYGLTYVRGGERKSVETKPRRRRMREAASPEPEKPKYTRKYKPGFSKKLSERDLEKKRRDMMENATWRDEQRKLNVTRFNKEEEKEKEAEKRISKREAGREKGFINDIKLHSSRSVEDTIRRKKHTLSKV